MRRSGRIRLPGARGRAAGALALAGAALLGYVLLQPAGSAAIPGWEPVNAQVAEALGEETAGGKAGAAEKGSAAMSGSDAGRDNVDGSAGSAAGSAAAASPAADGTSPAEPPKASPVAGASASPTAEAPGKLNLNTATAEQLDALKGIGPAKAQAIVEYREQQGAFHNVDELLNVRGIGSKLLEGIRSEVTV
ncbi:ComEA family DNA-binding protein [Cohnella lubricantis]|uniref:ComEA family DNA-binding protein n=1 Tax=Cohnella lubricantis TaxID=2163172 RepID=A0A841T6V2_9BACL|nr:ComEA family DNA-binding protein [Cohnella lubricantis]MBB6675776.1 ComEA family DNA-binding protein [Cohnella lubricantis]MBP2119851.1 competence protein ComEA [Cohnella lubricantis]